VRKPAIEALNYPATAFKEGFVARRERSNWNAADDNNASAIGMNNNCRLTVIE
jgi:hypothetical protein